MFNIESKFIFLNVNILKMILYIILWVKPYTFKNEFNILSKKYSYLISQKLIFSWFMNPFQ